ncbi:MAG: sortase [Nocardioides sp.]
MTAATFQEGPVGRAWRRRPGRPGGRRPVAAPRATRPIRAGGADEAVSLASSALTVVAIICAWMLLQLLVLGAVVEDRSQSLLYTTFRQQLAAGTAPTGALDVDGNPLAPGSPVALLTIPTLGVSQVVVSGTSSGDLLAGPGHLRTTPLPGQAGVSVVMGRGATYGAPFRDLAELAPGATIDVQNAQGRVVYTVEDVRHAGDPVPAALTGRQARLTLVSAQGRGSLAALRPQEAVFVDAVTTRPVPTGPVAGGALPASELPMARDSGALPMLVLLLAGVALLVLGTSAATRRFRGALVWVLATPCVIALAWATTDQVVRLLPNLM